MFKKFKGHYSKRKTHKTDRDVMSYEDMPLDDYEQEKTEMSPQAVKKIVLGACIAIAAGLIVFAFANRDKLTWENISNWWTYDVLGNAGHGYPVDIIGSEVSSGNFAVSQGHAVYASDTSFVTLTNSGTEVARLQLTHSNPVMKNNENRFLTYGIGSASYEISSFDETLYSGNAENKIYTGDVASNGTYCLVTEDNGYLTTLYAYSKNNNRIYKYSFSEYYITSVAINKDGSGCVATGVSSDKGSAVTGVYVLDFSQEKPVSTYKISGDSVLDCKYLTSDTAVLVGSQASYIVKKGEKNYKTVSYEDKTLSNYCFNTDTSTYTMALSRSGDGRSVALISYNSNGEAQYTINTEHKADSLSVYNGTVAILDGNVVYGYNQNGDLLYSTNSGTGSKKIVLASDYTAYILSVNQIRFIDLDSVSSDDTAQTSKQE